MSHYSEHKGVPPGKNIYYKRNLIEHNLQEAVFGYLEKGIEIPLLCSENVISAMCRNFIVKLIDRPLFGYLWCYVDLTIQ